ARYAHRVYEPDGRVNAAYKTLTDQQEEERKKREALQEARAKQEARIAREQEEAKAEMIETIGTLTSTDSINNTRLAYGYRTDSIADELNPFGWYFEDAMLAGCEDCPSVIVWRAYEREIDKLRGIQDDMVNGTGDTASLLTRARASDLLKTDYLETLVNKYRYRIS
ncbi:MAG: hypothetical protein ACRCYP_08340, partial [Alphaproteobacteria bacterium]